VADSTRRAELEGCVRTALKKVPQIHQLLAHALDTDDLDVRLGALFCVTALKDISLAPNVAEAARDPRLAEAVTRALGKLGAPAGRELLARMATLSMPAQSAAAE